MISDVPRFGIWCGRIPERVAMQPTGHNTRSVFERYKIVSETDLTDVARRLDLATAQFWAQLHQFRSPCLPKTLLTCYTSTTAP
jgi:hypothetical protein